MQFFLSINLWNKKKKMICVWKSCLLPRCFLWLDFTLRKHLPWKHLEYRSRRQHFTQGNLLNSVALFLKMGHPVHANCMHLKHMSHKKCPMLKQSVFHYSPIFYLLVRLYSTVKGFPLTTVNSALR